MGGRDRGRLAERTIVALALGTLGACTMAITQPVNNPTVCPPVQVVVSWSSSVSLANFSASLDGGQLPAGTFTIDNTNSQATAALTVNPGLHTLVVDGDLSTFFGAFGNHDRETAQFTGMAPTLAFTTPPVSMPARSTVTIVGSANCGMPPGTVTLNPSGSGIALGNQQPGGADTVPVQNGQFSDQVTGITAGSTIVTTSGTSFQNASIRIDVTPVLNAATPAQAMVGAGVSLTGNGFAPGATAQFGGRSVNANFVSATQLTATVPPVSGALPASTNVVVTVAGQSSNSLPFVVQRPPPALAQIIFRSSDSEIESVDVSVPAQLAEIDHQPATPATAASPQLALDGAGHLLRTTSGDVQVFNIDPQGHMTLLAGMGAQPSSTGTAVAGTATTVFRAIDTGLQSFQLSGSRLQPPNIATSTASAAGVGLDVARNIAVRAHSTGIDVFDVSNPASMRLLGSNGFGAVSSPGVDVKIFAGGTRAVRAEASGIEIYDLSQPAVPALIATGLGTPAFSQTAVAVDAARSRIVRATPNGIELYDVAAPGTPIGSTNSTTSPTGVGVVIEGSIAFRGLASGIEAFNIAGGGNPVRLGIINLTPAFTGVALTGP